MRNNTKFEEKPIVGFEFSHDEKLYAILENGRVFKFDLVSNRAPELS